MSATTRLNLRFILVMALFAGTLLLAYREEGVGLLLAPWATVTAELALTLLHCLGIEAVRVGTVISHPDGFAYEIYYRCTDFLPVALLSVATVAYGGRRRHKFIGLAVGIPILIALNLTRLVHLYYLGVHNPAAFDWAHGVLWEGLLILAVLGLWLGWVRWSDSQPRTGRRQPTFAEVRRVW